MNFKDWNFQVELYGDFWFEDQWTDEQIIALKEEFAQAIREIVLETDYMPTPGVWIGNTQYEGLEVQSISFWGNRKIVFWLQEPTD